jgi:hypothetical protein
MKGTRKGDVPMEILVLAIGILFFMLALAYVKICEIL